MTSDSLTSDSVGVVVVVVRLVKPSNYAQSTPQLTLPGIPRCCFIVCLVSCRGPSKWCRYATSLTRRRTSRGEGRSAPGWRAPSVCCAPSWRGRSPNLLGAAARGASTAPAPGGPFSFSFHSTYYICILYIQYECNRSSNDMYLL